MPLIISICVVCGGAVAAPVDICYACAAIDTTMATRAMKEQRPAADPGTAARPVLTLRDFAMLERFARLRLRPDDPAAQGLLEKLDRSRVVPTDALATDVVALGSRVIFSVDDGPSEARLLVLPAQHAAAGWTLPVTTPRGLALLGQTAGAIVTTTRSGDAADERLRVLAVAYRAEAAVMARGKSSGSWDAAAPQPEVFRSLARFWPVGARRVEDGVLPTMR